MPDISKIKLKDDLYYNLKDSVARETLNYYPPTANSKNSIARGNDITPYFKDGSLYTRISSGTFDDLFIGDYFTADYNGTTKTFRIAGFNTFYNMGDTPLTTNHVVIVPDEYLTLAQMNPTNTTVGGYVGSTMYTTTIGNIATESNTDTVNGSLYGIFGEHLLVTKELLTLSINETDPPMNGISWVGVANKYGWRSCQAVLMSEVEVFGCNVFSSSACDIGNANTQLPLFRLMPQCKNPGRYWYWFKGVASSSYFCVVESYGDPTYGTPSAQYGVRPRFVIG